MEQQGFPENEDPSQGKTCASSHLPGPGLGTCQGMQLASCMLQVMSDALKGPEGLPGPTKKEATQNCGVASPPDAFPSHMLPTLECLFGGCRTGDWSQHISCWHKNSAGEGFKLWLGEPSTTIYPKPCEERQRRAHKDRARSIRTNDKSKPFWWSLFAWSQGHEQNLS